MARSAIRIPPIAGWLSDTYSECVAIAWRPSFQTSLLVCRWFQSIRGTQNIRKRIGYFEEALKRNSRCAETRPAIATRIQTIRACLLSYGHRRLGYGILLQRRPGLKPWC
jgi:hypothetical protein